MDTSMDSSTPSLPSPHAPYGIAVPDPECETSYRDDGRCRPSGGTAVRVFAGRREGV
eukprot:CAMPEP_0175070140 /NCGR_PEP_ID=MMETSP0052_2-20121109/18556_1 /TAXON_ID=51329 ORGANISM="Polytomella parva, Strain SAG 63-3" /NCGR_SAMPLE_ID=MMETSP0052_2 /ASSEMBLY_ACC=CAM_ASM_000194 /LENGTH=56 /DNA_ID=CAMNT_0016337235 /DNA_START=230 /DNA_END=397 /DNA_ORIENTATION=+